MLAALVACAALAGGCAGKSDANSSAPDSNSAAVTPGTPAEPAREDGAPPEVDLVPSGPIVVRDAVGARAWAGTAERIHWRGTAATLRLTTVRCSLFEGDQRVLEASANEALVDEEHRRVTLRGAVRARSLVQDAQFQADEVVWDIRTRRLTATGHITVVRGEMRLTGGTRLEADGRLDEVQLDGHLQFEGRIGR